MRLTILGAGTCMPSPVRGCAAYWIEADTVRLRLDCGPGSVSAMARFGLPWETLTHQFISHFHLDHVGELPGLLFSFKYGRSAPRSLPLTIVGPIGLSAYVEQANALHQAGLLDQEFPVRIRELAPGDALALAEGMTLRVAKTPHTPESLAVRLETEGRVLGYTGDTAAAPELVTFFAGADLLIAECSYLEPKPGVPHLAADEVATLASAAQVGQLVATHFYFDPDTERVADRLAQGYRGPIAIGRDGMTFDLSATL